MMRARQSLNIRVFQWGLVLAGAAFSSQVEAHRVSSVSLVSYLETKEATYVLDAAMEVVPSEEQALNDQISPEDAARQFAEDYLVVMFDRKDQKPEIEIRVETTSDDQTPLELRRQQVLTKLSGKIPEGASEFLLYLDPSCPMAVVMVVIKDSQPSRRMQVVLAGEYSRPISVAPLKEGDPFSVAENPSAVQAEASKEKGKENKAESAAPGGGAGAFRAGLRASAGEGGLLILFIPGILLLTLDRRSVLLQVGLVLAGLAVAVSLVAVRMVALPDWSPLVFKFLFAGIALEALFHDRLRWWRLPLLGLAGIFAGFEAAWTPSFREIFSRAGAGAGDLIRFLPGLELALVLVALLAALLLLLLSRFDWYRRALVHPLAVLLVGYGVFGVVELFL